MAFTIAGVNGLVYLGRCLARAELVVAVDQVGDGGAETFKVGVAAVEDLLG